MSNIDNINLLKGAKSPLIWLNSDTPSRRDPHNQSQFNPLEAKIVATLSSELAQAFGTLDIMVLTAYESQVRKF
jgi:superfamily I DNA and/or RNA helicase